MSWFDPASPKEVIKYVVVPVSEEKPLDLTQEVKESVLALQHNPGFKYLLSRCKSVKAYLARQLAQNKHADLQEVAYLQAGIFWASFLEDEMTKSQPKNPLPQPSDGVIDAFNAAKAALDVVGIDH